MHQAKKLWKVTFGYFDKLEDRIRFRLSRHPITYAIIGAIGIILVWKGVWDFADQVHLNGLFAFGLGLIILLATGLMVSFFIGDSIIISGFRREKKLVDKTEAELASDEARIDRITSELKHIEKDLEDIRKHEAPHIRL